MKKFKTSRWKRPHQHTPFIAQAGELLVAVIVLAAAQNIWAVLVGANPDITPPSVPINLQMTGRSASSIDLSWDASTDDTAVTGYHVFRNGTQVGSPSVTSYSDSGLTPNTSYTYTVTAYDAATNESAPSAPLVRSTLADTTAPSTPTNLHQTGATTSTVSIAWNASSDNVGVTGYDIYRNGSLVRSQSGTSYTDTGLAVYTHYIYAITAHDGSNNSSLLSSSLGADTTPDTTPPSVPDNLHKTSSTVSSISLAWNAATDDVGITGYHVYRNGSLVGSPGGTSFTDSGLSVSSSYNYTVSAYDAASNASNQSAPYNTSSSDDVTAPTIPANLHTTELLDTSVKLAWDASTDDVNNPVTGYKVYRDNVLIGTAATTHYDDSGLTPVTDYSYKVEAYDAANNTSAASGSLAVQTAYDTTSPSTPANLAITGRTDTTIALSWSMATDNVGVTGYDVYRGGSLISTTVGTTYSDSGLGVNTAYTYRVRAHDASSNNSPQSAPLNTSTLPDAVAPTAPTNLLSPSQTTTTIDLTWDAATDDVAVTAYNVYRNGSLIGTTTDTNYSDTGRHYNTSYSYTVTAIDAADNESAPSTARAAATLPDTTPPNVTLTAPTDGQAAQLTFPITASASDDLDLNRLEFYVDGSLIASQTSAPFGLNWNSYAVHNGPHSVSVKAIDTSGNYSSQTATITINNPPPALVADLNGDHRINIFDLSILLSHWRKSGAGDFNNNGKVDIFDLSVLLSRYGQDNSNYH